MRDFSQMSKSDLVDMLRQVQAMLPMPSLPENIIEELQKYQRDLEMQNREMREIHQLLEQSRDRYADLFDFAPIGYVTFEARGVIQEINLTGAKMLGVERSRLIKMPFSMYVAKSDVKKFRQHLQNCRLGTGHVTTELTLTPKGGDEVNVQLYSSMVHDVERDTTLCRTAITDISELKRAEEKLRYMSTHDMLTGLYNRAYFDEEMERLKEDGRYPISIVIADVDRLKEVNDRLGHPAGDVLLKQAAQLLKNAFRLNDLVARIGGDEFAAILPQTSAEEVKEIIERFNVALADLNATAVGPEISLSLGATTVEDGSKLIDAMIQADARMYQDKLMRSGRATPDIAAARSIAVFNAASS